MPVIVAADGLRRCSRHVGHPIRAMRRPEMGEHVPGVQVDRGHAVLSFPFIHSGTPGSTTRRRASAEKNCDRFIDDGMHDSVGAQRADRFAWKRMSGYYDQAQAENALARCKRTFGGRLRAKRGDAQEREASLARALLNRMRDLGRPLSYRVSATRDSRGHFDCGAIHQTTTSDAACARHFCSSPCPHLHVSHTAAAS